MALHCGGHLPWSDMQLHILNDMAHVASLHLTKLGSANSKQRYATSRELIFAKAVETLER